jgi:hypothetical protein
MTERYGYRYRDEPGGGERPSGRGAIAERRAGQEEEVREIDLTDEVADREQEIAGAEPPRDEREASGAFEPHPVAAAGTSIFDVGRDEEAAMSDPAEPAAEEAEREAAEGDATDQAEPEAAEHEAAAATAERDERDETERERTEAEAEGDEAEREVAAEAEHDEGEGAAAMAEPEAEPGAAEAQAAEEPAAPAAVAGAPEALLGSLDAEGARNRFLDIQAGFVDEPRQAVEEAGGFVDELVQRVTDALQAQRSQLQAAGDDASTEDLRLTLRAYRQFVDRLLGLAR